MSRDYDALAAAILALAEKGERDGRGNSLELARALRAAVSADGVADHERRLKAEALREAADDPIWKAAAKAADDTTDVPTITVPQVLHLRADALDHGDDQ